MRHAYLIIAHKNDLTFKTLLRMLDYSDNDIFVHFDAKAKDFDEACKRDLVESMRHSRLFFTKRLRVTWGAFSMVKCELELLRAAVSTEQYDYYHLLSGEDLPIQTQEYISRFFENNKGKQFVVISKMREDNNYHDWDRVRYYHFVQEKVGKKSAVELSFPLRFVRKVPFLFQDAFKLYRHKRIVFMKGSQWFSITDELAKYVLCHENWIRKTFRWTKCADEHFLQTLIHETKYEGQLYKQGALCNVDWERGDPWIWRMEDVNQLYLSQQLFARKFDAKVDSAIIQMLKEHYCISI